MEFMTATEANERAKANFSRRFDETLQEVKNRIEKAVGSGLMEVVVYVNSTLMQEKISDYFEQLGYSISCYQAEMKKYKDEGYYIIIYWGDYHFRKTMSSLWSPSESA